MQPKRSLIYILAVLITLPLFGTVAPATTIDVIQTFDFPGATATLPQKISDQTDLIGTTIYRRRDSEGLYLQAAQAKVQPPVRSAFRYRELYSRPRH